MNVEGFIEFDWLSTSDWAADVFWNVCYFFIGLSDIASSLPDDDPVTDSSSSISPKSFSKATFGWCFSSTDDDLFRSGVFLAFFFVFVGVEIDNYVIVISHSSFSSLLTCGLSISSYSLFSSITS